MAAIYNGLEFKTRLEAEWAAFFDLAGWSYWTNPVAVGEWQPDFKLQFKCSHSECGGYHVLFASMLPAKKLADVKDHPAQQHNYEVKLPNGQWVADGGAIFGANPSVTTWEISHGSGGGGEDINFRVENARDLWFQALNLVEAANP